MSDNTMLKLLLHKYYSTKFIGIMNTPNECYRRFKQEFALVILRAKVRHKQAMIEWLEALV